MTISEALFNVDIDWYNRTDRSKSKTKCEGRRSK